MILDLRVVVHLHVIVDLKVRLDLGGVIVEVVSNVEQGNHAIENNNDDHAIDVVGRHNAEVDAVVELRLKHTWWKCLLDAIRLEPSKS